VSVTSGWLERTVPRIVVVPVVDPFPWMIFARSANSRAIFWLAAADAVISLTRSGWLLRQFRRGDSATERVSMSPSVVPTVRLTASSGSKSARMLTGGRAVVALASDPAPSGGAVGVLHDFRAEHLLGRSACDAQPDLARGGTSWCPRGRAAVHVRLLCSLNAPRRRALVDDGGAIPEQASAVSLPGSRPIHSSQWIAVCSR